MERHTLSATSIIGDGVRNPAGDKLGDIKDIMIDLGSGRISYVVLGMGGFLGVGDTLFAVPFPALTLDSDEHEFVLAMDRETLENAPGFDKDDWPDFSDRTWGSQVHQFYGRRPYWDD